MNPHLDLHETLAVYGVTSHCATRNEPRGPLHAPRPRGLSARPAVTMTRAQRLAERRARTRRRVRHTIAVVFAVMASTFVVVPPASASLPFGLNSAGSTAG